MRTTCKLSATLGLLLAASIAVAQPPASVQKAVDATIVAKKSSLEEALDQALKNNPDLRVAEAKLSLAAAELSRARLQVTHSIAAMSMKIDVQEKMVAETEEQMTHSRDLFRKGAANRADVAKAETAATLAKGQLAVLRHEFAAMQGKGEAEAKARIWLERISPQREQGLLASRIVQVTGNQRGREEKFDALRKALRIKVNLTFDQIESRDVLDFLEQRSNLNIHAEMKGAAWATKLTCDLKDVTVAAGLQFLEDHLTGQTVIVRDYGLLIVPKEKVPPDALTLAAFVAAGDVPAKTTEKGPPTKEAPGR